MNNWKDKLFIPPPQEKEFPEILREVAKRTGMQGKAVVWKFSVYQNPLFGFALWQPENYIGFSPHPEKRTAVGNPLPLSHSQCDSLSFCKENQNKFEDSTKLPFKSQVIGSLQRKQITLAFDSLKTIGTGGNWGEELGAKPFKNQKWLRRLNVEWAVQSLGAGEILGEETSNR